MMMDQFVSTSTQQQLLFWIGIPHHEIHWCGDFVKTERFRGMYEQPNSIHWSIFRYVSLSSIMRLASFVVFITARNASLIVNFDGWNTGGPLNWMSFILFTTTGEERKKVSRFFFSLLLSSICVVGLFYSLLWSSKCAKIVWCSSWSSAPPLVFVHLLFFLSHTT